MPSHLRLIEDDYEAAEAERRERDGEVSQETRAEIDSFYGAAAHAGNAAEVRYIEVLAADIDVHDRHGRPSLLAQLRSNHQTAA